MFRFRRVNIDKGKDTLLESHCRINYDSETPNMRKVPFEQYRKKWLSTSQPKSYLLDLAETMREKRTVAEILEDMYG